MPTSIASLRGQLFVGNLGLFPITPDSSRILTITADEAAPVNVPGPCPCAAPTGSGQILRVSIDPGT